MGFGPPQRMFAVYCAQAIGLRAAIYGDANLKSSNDRKRAWALVIWDMCGTGLYEMGPEFHAEVARFVAEFGPFEKRSDLEDEPLRCRFRGWMHQRAKESGRFAARAIRKSTRATLGLDEIKETTQAMRGLLKAGGARMRKSRESFNLWRSRNVEHHRRYNAANQRRYLAAKRAKKVKP